ncbi:MAG: hypothetical protein H6548_07830 [Chitinophagales bacterium]|nr:hypothetical protein [Chitinophagales bacterium]MCB9031739.1 hypothetical protein [Chitinophagales bacterium]HPE96587.1 hypothetical protein [Chitinophagales bacterium]HPR29685.1 hypothetical protein [Chitinophagales bacterium]HQU38254.1 hypothetical protein [Chitinophagales bacterium]
MNTDRFYRHKHKAFSIIPIVLAVSILLVSGCRKGPQLPHPDVSGIEVDASIHRFDEALMAADGSNYREVMLAMELQDSAFFHLYTGQILNMRPYGDSTFSLYDTLYKYMVADPYMIRLYDSTKALFPDMRSQEKALQKALKYYSYYFPEMQIPSFYAYIAPFVYQVVVADEVIGIELNMFMGKDFSYYSELSANLPQYLVYRFDPDYMVVSVMRAMMDGSIPNKGADGTLLDDMLAEGKMMYYLDLMLPDLPDSIKIGFTEEQLNFCYDNESDIWKFFAGEELLFSTRNQDRQRYLGESPGAYGMPEGAPGRIGIWVGWQMVRAYMDAHPETNIHQLLLMTEGLDFLQESGYKP